MCVAEGDLFIADLSRQINFSTFTFDQLRWNTDHSSLHSRSRGRRGKVLQEGSSSGGWFLSGRKRPRGGEIKRERRRVASYLHLSCTDTHLISPRGGERGAHHVTPDANVAPLLLGTSSCSMVSDSLPQSGWLGDPKGPPM